MSSFNEVVEQFRGKYESLLASDKDTLRILRKIAAPEVFDSFALEGLRNAVATAERKDERPSRADYQRKRRQEKAGDEAYAELHKIPLADVHAQRARDTVAAFYRTLNEEAARRAIRMLDIWMVGGIPLGDLTAVDFHKAASDARYEASLQTKHAEFYTRLANILSPGIRLRDCNERDKVLEILRDMAPEE